MILEKTIRLFVAALGGTTLLAGTAPAANVNGENVKVHPGSMCVRWAGSSLSYSWSAIRADTGRSYVDCPVVRDEFPYRLGPTGEAMSAVAYFRHNGSSDYPRCAFASVRMYAQRASGWVTPWDTGMSHAGGSFDRIHASDYHMYLSCRIPGPVGGVRARLTSFVSIEAER